MKTCHLTVLSKNLQSINNFLLFFQNNIELNFNIIKRYFQKKRKRKILTILKSPHVNKTAQEQFEYKEFSKQLIIYSTEYSKCLILLKKLKTNLFPDIRIKVKFILNLKNVEKLRVKTFDPDNFKGNFYQNGIYPIESKNLEKIKFKEFNANYTSLLKTTEKILEIKDVYGELIKTRIKKFR